MLTLKYFVRCLLTHTLIIFARGQVDIPADIESNDFRYKRRINTYHLILLNKTMLMAGRVLTIFLELIFQSIFRMFYL